MSQHYIDAVHFRNIGAIKHFMAYLVGLFGHPGGDFKEIKSKYKLKVKYIFETESVMFSCVAVLF